MAITPEQIAIISSVAHEQANGLKGLDEGARNAFLGRVGSQEYKEEVAATFGAADTNGDGVLDQHEYVDFMEKYH